MPAEPRGRAGGVRQAAGSEGSSGTLPLGRCKLKGGLAGSPFAPRRFDPPSFPKVRARSSVAPSHPMGEGTPPRPSSPRPSDPRRTGRGEPGLLAHEAAVLDHPNRGRDRVRVDDPRIGPVLDPRSRGGEDPPRSVSPEAVKHPHLPTSPTNLTYQPLPLRLRLPTL